MKEKPADGTLPEDHPTEAGGQTDSPADVADTTREQRTGEAPAGPEEISTNPSSASNSMEETPGSATPVAKGDGTPRAAQEPRAAVGSEGEHIQDHAPPTQAPHTPTVSDHQPAQSQSSVQERGHKPTSSPAIPPSPHFVSPLSYLRPASTHRNVPSGTTHPQPAPEIETPIDKDQKEGLRAIREFLKVRTSYDVLPLSFRLIVLDTELLIKKSLSILIQNSIVSAPLWNSTASKFAGLLTSTDYINVIQYYCQFPDEMHKLDQFKLSSLRDIEKAIGAVPIETVSVHPSRPLYEACRQMLKTRARRIPLVDVDEETGKETVVSVITQYRILKFIAVNNERNTVLLRKNVREIGLGTYKHLTTATMTNTVLDVVHLMVKHNISCVPIIDEHNHLLNAFEAVDIIPCIKGGAYEELDDTVGEALCKRPDDSPGIYTCGEGDRLESVFETVRKSRVHRLMVIDEDNRLKGIISLSDILKYVLEHGEEEDENRA